MPAMTLQDIGRRAQAAAVELATAGTAAKDAALRHAADRLDASTPAILEENRADVEAARSDGLRGALVDRLTLTEGRVASMAAGLREIAALPDPVGETIEGWRRPNGLEIRKVRVPLGVVAVIYEARPNVTSDVAGLCLKSGNAAILRGSATAARSNRAVADELRRAVAETGLPEDSVHLFPDTLWDWAVELMLLLDFVDILIPRDGPALIRTIL